MLNYFKEVRAEMKHVSWPSRQMAIMYTLVVIVVSLMTAVYLGVWDQLFTAIVKRII